MQSNESIEPPSKRGKVEDAECVNITDTKAVCEIKFSNGYRERGKDFKLFEVPKEFAEEFNGSSCRVVGDDTNDAVLCSSRKTYAIKQVETSNSVFLVPPSATNSFEVHSLHGLYYEVVPTPPRLEKLEQWLKSTAYTGKSVDEESTYVKSNLVKMSDIRNRIQASDAELDDALRSMGASEIDGYVRVVDKQALQDVVGQILDTVMEQRWSLDNITVQACLEQMSGVDERILVHALRCLSGKRYDQEDPIKWQLDHKQVARSVAQKLFRTRLAETGSNRWDVTDFHLNWAVHMPISSDSGSSACSSPSEEYLQGIAIKESVEEVGNVKGDAPRAVYLFLPIDDMSSSPQARFRQLFNAKSRYSLEEIEPYLTDLYGKSGQPKSCAELLLAHANLIDGYYVPKL
mmetsp:Transcript_26260/g.38928  ORF Transcript_26260/g.38928 Transcript_26260/m.38928 type:complete len:403 (+) Transcript_26260:57-1265(+)